MAVSEAESSIFVAHEEMEGGPVLDGHRYWKMRILSIHQGVGSSKWIVGTWFYSPSNLQEVLRKRYVTVNE